MTLKINTVFLKGKNVELAGLLAYLLNLLALSGIARATNRTYYLSILIQNTNNWASLVAQL